MTKAFSAGRDNHIRLTFPNGNTMSTVWGFGTYSDNHFPKLDDWDMTKDSEFSKLSIFFNPETHGSDTVEVLYGVDPETQAKINARFPEMDNPLGYLKLEEWLDLVLIVSGRT